MSETVRGYFLGREHDDTIYAATVLAGNVDPDPELGGGVVRGGLLGGIYLHPTRFDAEQALRERTQDGGVPCR